MKLALIVPGGFQPVGRDGVIPALVALAQELAVRHEVHVFVANAPGTEVEYPLVGAHIHQIGDGWAAEPTGIARRGLAWGRLGWQLARQIERASSSGGFHLLHGFWAGGPGLLAGLLGRRLRVPVVISVGGGEAVWLPEIGYGGAGSFMGRARTRLALRLADEITIGSDFGVSFLAGPVASRARVVPLGIACDRFFALPTRPSGPPWRLLHVGSLNRVKDQQTLLEAFGEVVAHLGDVWLDCVGEDTLGGRVQEQARALGLAPRVRFLGVQSQDALVPLYRDAHLLVVSSRYESQGVVILEAAAAGLPTVGTAVGVLPTLAPAGASCVPTGDPRRLAAAIVAQLSDDASRHAIGASAQRFALAHDVAWTARTFEDIYRRLVGRGDHPADY